MVSVEERNNSKIVSLRPSSVPRQMGWINSQRKSPWRYLWRREVEPSNSADSSCHVFSGSKNWMDFCRWISNRWKSSALPLWPSPNSKIPWTKAQKILLATSQVPHLTPGQGTLPTKPVIAKDFVQREPFLRSKLGQSLKDLMALIVQNVADCDWHMDHVVLWIPPTRKLPWLTTPGI